MDREANIIVRLCERDEKKRKRIHATRRARWRGGGDKAILTETVILDGVEADGVGIG